MQVAELLRGKGSQVTTVAPTESVHRVVALLREYNIGALVVSTDGSQIDGIISERDIVRALGDSSDDVLGQTVSEIMTSDVHTCTPEDRVDSLMALMTEKRIRHLPVQVDGQLTGIVSIGDVVKRRVSQLEFETQALTDYIQQGR